MAPDMTAFGKKAWLTAEDDWCMLMVMCIMASGKKTRLMGMEHNKTTMGVGMKVAGLTTNNMAKEKKPGQMGQLMWANTLKE